MWDLKSSEEKKKLQLQQTAHFILTTLYSIGNLVPYVQPHSYDMRFISYVKPITLS